MVQSLTFTIEIDETFVINRFKAFSCLSFAYTVKRVYEHKITVTIPDILQIRRQAVKSQI